MHRQSKGIYKLLKLVAGFSQVSVYTDQYRKMSIEFLDTDNKQLDNGIFFSAICKECKMVQLLWKTLEIELPYNAAILFLGI